MQDRRIMLKIICFSGDHQFFQISPGIRSLYERGKEPINLLAGEALFGTGVAILENLLAGEATRAHLTLTLGQDV